MTAPPMLSESVTLKRFNRTRGKKTQRPEGWFFGVSSWFEGGRVALIMWEDSRTSQYHSRKALHGGRTEQLSKKKKIKRPYGFQDLAEPRLESQEHQELPRDLEQAIEPL